MKIFQDIALCVPQILLPNKNINYTKWSVIACDQYTSQPEYWKRVENFVENSPSTLHITFPEVYLDEKNSESRIEKINENMEKYLNENIFAEPFEGFVLVDRKTPYHKSRKGLVVALDLEEYDYLPDATTLIKATEGTILDRLPPRIKVRKNALLEIPHIMVLIDDPEKTVIEPLFEICNELIYDFELMENAGHIKGYAVNSEKAINQIAQSLQNLASKETFERKYSAKGKSPVLYAMGDGNHSFATAKAIWEDLKKNSADNKDIMNNPARFALVELVNIHDEGLDFEPIHRVVFNVDSDEFFEQMKRFFNSIGSKCHISETINECSENRHIIPFITENKKGFIIIENPKFNLELASLQSFIDEYLKINSKSKVDYIHGENTVSELGSKKGNIGFYLPAIDKFSFFKTIIFDGAFPRKTFSMGEADEKRFYLECRRIK